MVNGVREAGGRGDAGVRERLGREAVAGGVIDEVSIRGRMPGRDRGVYVIVEVADDPHLLCRKVCVEVRLQSVGGVAPARPTVRVATTLRVEDDDDYVLGRPV